MSERARDRSPSIESEDAVKAIRHLAAAIFGWLDNNAMLAVMVVLAVNIVMFFWLPSSNKEYVWGYPLAVLNLAALAFCATKFRMRRR